MRARSTLGHTLSATHVIPALIRKIVDARRANAPAVEVWGTGRASREFLYVEDCAHAILPAAERYDAPQPVNIGAGAEICIADLAAMIARLCGYDGQLTFNASLPDGQPRRSFDGTRAEVAFGFKATTSLRDGLPRTISWYERQLHPLAARDALRDGEAARPSVVRHELQSPPLA